MSFDPATPNVNGLVSNDRGYAQRVMVFAIATLAELRESDTESHLVRVQKYVRLLARQLASRPAPPSIRSKPVYG